MFLQQPQDSELLDRQIHLYSKTPFISGMYIFYIQYDSDCFSRNIMVEFLFSYFMLGWNGTWVVNNVSRPKTKGKFSIEMSRCFSDEAEHQVGVWVVEIDPSEVDRIREQVPSPG